MHTRKAPLKTGILGCRGIPNRYGGFEELAEHLSAGLAEKGLDVWVYNSHNHPCKDKVWRGVNRLFCNDPEHRTGQAGQFIYDLNCINDSRRRAFDIILQLGYTSSSIWYFRLPPNTQIITNMDGLEWKRSKYGWPVRKFLQYAEKLAVRHSDALVADNPAIRQYLSEKYNVSPEYIAYGATIPDLPPLEQQIPVQLHLPGRNHRPELHPRKYFLLIARLQPDNHIEEIIRGVIGSGSELPLVIVGDCQKGYGRCLEKKYASDRVYFAGSVYDKELLNSLRSKTRLYFHGHSAGGTNPSLLEAMAASAPICANDNSFNRAVLHSNALYFNDADDIAYLIKKGLDEHEFSAWTENNREKIKKDYSWEQVIEAYCRLFSSALPGEYVR